MNEKPMALAAVFELVAAAALWGFGFIAVVWTLAELGPLSIAGLRFGLAALAGGAICLLIPSLRKSLSWSQFHLAFWPGLFLASTLILQTWGLRYTTATKSGFITTLYVLFVPFMERVLLGRKIPRYHLFFVFLTLVGVALICDLPQMFAPATLQTALSKASEKEAWNFGDWLTLGSSVAATLQIVWFGKIANRIGSSFAFNTYQCIWAAPIPLVFAFAFERPTLNLSLQPMIGLCMLAFASSVIAFSLQIKAQKNISPSVASLLFLLESPFAAFFGIFFLGERVTFQNSVGCTIIIVSLAASVLFSQAELQPQANQ